MTILAHETDHEGVGAACLISDLQKPKLIAFLKSLLSETQAAEDAAWGIYTGFDVDNAVGAQLDVIGRIVNQARGKLLDTPYRARIKARILVNRSSGTPEQIIAIVKLIVGAARVQVVENFPAAFSIYVLDPIDASVGNELAKLMREARALGVSPLIYWHSTSTPFSFSDIDASTPDMASANGFGTGQLAGVSTGVADVRWV